MTPDDLDHREEKRAAAKLVAARSASFVGLSELLHGHPEIGWEEVRASAWVGDELAGFGYDVTPAYLGLETAIHATFGTGPTTIGLVAEYDALPGLGHACGHNIIAAAAVGAAAALRPLVDDLGLTIVIYGTPAEEGGGGKIELLERGAFTELDLAMMVHPAPVDVAEAEPFAVSHLRIGYAGRAAHAAAYAEEGVNAADAFTVAQVAIGLLRQQLPNTSRVHGVVTEAGLAPNAIPGRSSGRWYVRAESLATLTDIESRVMRCFEAGALATGCELSVEPESKPYAELRADRRALESYVRNATAIGRRFRPGTREARMNRASTDLGNVSQVVPVIHPYIGVGSWPVINHQAEFAGACVGPTAEQAILDGATALAWTAIDRARAHPS